MKRLSLLLLAIGLMCCSSCAFMNERNRPLMTLCQKSLFPKGTSAKIATAPVTWPVTGVAVVVDTVLIHPVLSLKQATYDTSRTLWVNWNHGWAGEAGLLPLRVIGTPPIWALVWVERCFIDIPNWPPSPSRLARRVMGTDPKGRLNALADVPAPFAFTGQGAVFRIPSYAYDAADERVVGDALVKACNAAPADAAFCEAAISKMPAPLTPEALAYLTAVAQQDDGRIAAAAMIRLVAEASLVPSSDKPDPELKQHVEQVVNSIARLYDGLVESNRRQAEVTLMYLVAQYGWYPGVQATGLYIEHSLFKRQSPPYAEAASVFLQESLISSSQTAWLQATDEKWRVLHNDSRWATIVQRSTEQIAAGKQAELEQLIDAQKEEERGVVEQLSKLSKGDAVRLQGLTTRLLILKTGIDAEGFAIRLMDASATDRKIFFDKHPLKSLQNQKNAKQ